MLCFSLCFSLDGVLYAQEKQVSPVIFQLSQTEASITSKSMITLILKVVNNRNTILKGPLEITNDDGITLISRKQQLIELRQGDSIFIPIRLFPSGKMTAEEIYSVRTVLNDGKTGFKAECKLRMGSVKSVSLIPMISSLILGSRGDSIKIPVRIENSGNTAQKVNIVCQLPSGLQSSGFHTAFKLTMRPYSDTLIHINKSVNRDMLRMETFIVNVSGLYENGDLFGQHVIQVQTLKNLRINDTGLSAQYYQGSFDNSFTLSSQNVGKEYASYQVYGGSTVETPYGRFGLNADATVWKNNNTPYLRNTYISYEGNNMGITAGNISRAFETNINGRGLSLFYTDTASDNSYEAGFADQSSNFIDPYYFSGTSGKAGWTRFKRQKAKLQFANTMLYETNPYVGTNNAIIANELGWTSFKNMRVSTEFNAGYSADQDNTDRRKLGYLGAFNIEGKAGRFDFSINNLLSSAYYPGLRKGSMILNERVSYTGDRMRMWGSYNYINVDPESVVPLSYKNQFDVTRAELGISASYNKFLVSVFPLYAAESNSYTFFQNNPQNGTMRSYRLAAQLNYTNPFSAIYLFLTAEGGTSKNSFSNRYNRQFKFNGSLKKGIFNFTGNYQIGNFYVSEVLNNNLLNIDESRLINLNATLKKSLLNNKAEIEAGASYNKTRASGNSVMLTGRAEYNVNSQTRVFASLFRTEYKYMNYTYNNLQIGLTRKLPAGRIGSKNNTIELCIYKDNNENRVFDQGDIAAKGQIVYINNTAFITNSQGKVIYKNLLEGVYSVNIPSSGNWYSPPQSVVLGKEDLKLDIPLSKTGMIEGRLEYNFDEFSYEIAKEKAGFTISAQSESGKVEQTKTNEMGQFLFYLPAGKYTVFIEGLPDKVVCSNNHSTLIVTEEGIGKIIFNLKVKARKVEVKKFSSPNISMKIK